MASTSSPAGGPRTGTSFLDLPPELRDQIYQYALEDLKVGSRYAEEACVSLDAPAPALSLVSHQVRVESAQTLVRVFPLQCTAMPADGSEVFTIQVNRGIGAWLRASACLNARVTITSLMFTTFPAVTDPFMIWNRRSNTVMYAYEFLQTDWPLAFQYAIRMARQVRPFRLNLLTGVCDVPIGKRSRKALGSNIGRHIRRFQAEICSSIAAQPVMTLTVMNQIARRLTPTKFLSLQYSAHALITETESTSESWKEVLDECRFMGVDPHDIGVSITHDANFLKHAITFASTNPNRPLSVFETMWLNEKIVLWMPSKMEEWWRIIPGRGLRQT